jgi:centractin
VLESGEGVTQCMSIYEGYSIPNSIDKIDLGGSDITNYLRLLLKRSGYSFNSHVPSSLK